MSESRTHSGGCHCGAVRYEVDAPVFESGVACNCSICNKSGSVLSFVPAAAFRLLTGEDVLTDYRFNKHVIHHVFCARCGIKSFARGRQPDGTPMVAINLRCVDGVDVTKLQVHHYDGASA